MTSQQGIRTARVPPPPPPPYEGGKPPIPARKRKPQVHRPRLQEPPEPPPPFEYHQHNANQVVIGKDLCRAIMELQAVPSLRWTGIDIDFKDFQARNDAFEADSTIFMNGHQFSTVSESSSVSTAAALHTTDEETRVFHSNQQQQEAVKRFRIDGESRDNFQGRVFVDEHSDLNLSSSSSAFQAKTKISTMTTTTAYYTSQRSNSQTSDYGSSSRQTHRLSSLNDRPTTDDDEELFHHAETGTENAVSASYFRSLERFDSELASGDDDELTAAFYDDDGNEYCQKKWIGDEIKLSTKPAEYRQPPASSAKNSTRGEDSSRSLHICEFVDDDVYEQQMEQLERAVSVSDDQEDDNDNYFRTFDKHAMTSTGGSVTSDFNKSRYESAADSTGSYAFGSLIESDDGVFDEYTEPTNRCLFDDFDDPVSRSSDLSYGGPDVDSVGAAAAAGQSSSSACSLVEMEREELIAQKEQFVRSVLAFGTTFSVLGRFDCVQQNGEVNQRIVNGFEKDVSLSVDDKSSLDSNFGEVRQVADDDEFRHNLLQHHEFVEVSDMPTSSLLLSSSASNAVDSVNEVALKDAAATYQPSALVDLSAEELFEEILESLHDEVVPDTSDDDVDDLVMKNINTFSARNQDLTFYDDAYEIKCLANDENDNVTNCLDGFADEKRTELAITSVENASTVSVVRDISLHSAEVFNDDDSATDRRTELTETLTKSDIELTARTASVPEQNEKDIPIVLRNQRSAETDAITVSLHSVTCNGLSVTSSKFNSSFKASRDEKTTTVEKIKPSFSKTNRRIVVTDESDSDLDAIVSANVTRNSSFDDRLDSIVERNIQEVSYVALNDELPNAGTVGANTAITDEPVCHISDEPEVQPTTEASVNAVADNVMVERKEDKEEMPESGSVKFTAEAAELKAASDVSVVSSDDSHNPDSYKVLSDTLTTQEIVLTIKLPRRKRRPRFPDTVPPTLIPTRLLTEDGQLVVRQEVTSVADDQQQTKPPFRHLHVQRVVRVVDAAGDVDSNQRSVYSLPAGDSDREIRNSDETAAATGLQDGGTAAAAATAADATEPSAIPSLRGSCDVESTVASVDSELPITDLKTPHFGQQRVDVEFERHAVSLAEESMPDSSKVKVLRENTVRILKLPGCSVKSLRPLSIPTVGDVIDSVTKVLVEHRLANRIPPELTVTCEALERKEAVTNPQEEGVSQIDGQLNKGVTVVRRTLLPPLNTDCDDVDDASTRSEVVDRSCVMSSFV